jgi:preprotein translocase subunit YajC
MDPRTLFPLLAQEDAVPAAEGGAALWLPQLVMFGAIGLIFYFLLIRPQQKQEKERRAMLESMKKKDRVVTNGGLLGTVADLRDDEVVLRISESPDVKVRIRRSSVVEVLREGTPAEAASQAGK